MEKKADWQAGHGKTVLLLGSFAPSLINFRGRLIEDLVRRGYRVFAAAPEIPWQIARKIEGLGAIPLSVELRRGDLNPFGALKTVCGLRRLMGKLKPDVIIAYTINPIVFGAMAARTLKPTRFIALITGLGYAFTGGSELKRRLVRAVAVILYRSAFRSTNLALFQNADDRREFERLRILPPGLRTELVAGSGIDVVQFSTVPLPTTLSFLMIGRFLKDKGIREYAYATERLKAQYPSVRVLLLGWAERSADAISSDEIERMAQSGVEIIGAVDDVRPIIGACSVFVLPSYREGTPRSVLEAMAMGRAIITTDAPGCRETVVDGVNGYLVPPRDGDALLNAMVRFVDRPELTATMGTASRALAIHKFEVGRVNRSIFENAGL